MIQSKVLETFVNERIEEHIREICRDNVNTDNLVHTARCFSARIPEVECIFSAT